MEKFQRIAYLKNNVVRIHRNGTYIRKAQFNVIGRMYSISPSQIELLHLPLLLITIKGAISFEDIRTVDGKKHYIFHSACLALGFIEDDAEWECAMKEGEIWMMPRQLRHL